MNLHAPGGEVSCMRCIISEVRSVGKLFNYGVSPLFVGSAIFNRPRGRDMRPHCE
jgi:hypothetical protein